MGAEVGDEAGAPSLVENALHRLWEQREGNTQSLSKHPCSPQSPGHSISLPSSISTKCLRCFFDSSRKKR